MTRRTWLEVGIGALALLAASGPALAQQVGLRADADFLSYPSDCLESQVHVFVRALPNGRGQIDASVLQIDYCKERTLVDARAKTNLAAGALSLNGRDLTLAATVQMLDAVTKNAISMKFDLQWVGGEQIAATISRELDRPGRFVRFERPARRVLIVAEASGTVSGGNKNFVAAPAENAALVLSR